MERIRLAVSATFFMILTTGMISGAASADELNISQTPIQVVGSVQPNVMILMDTSGSMNRDSNDNWVGAGNRRSRMYQAKSAARNVIDATDSVRFCLARLNGSHGGRILANCGSNKNSLKGVINQLPASGQTPVAEAYYEISRYFRGMTGHYTNSGRRYASPIQHSCQKNFAIVLTDGSPTSDGDFGSVRDSQGRGRLPNWDRSDNDSGRYYLDDIAKFVWDVDMAPGLDGKQNLHTYTIGFNFNHSMLERAAQVGNGEYYLAGNEADLTKSLKAALGDIGRKAFSTTALGASTGSTNTGLNLYQARFNSTDWSGSLFSYEVYSDKGKANFGQVNPVPSWEAGKVLTDSPSGRTIITAFDTSGGGQVAKAFNWNGFNSSDRNNVFDNNRDLARYLRGGKVSGYRERNTLLGDIVNSSPVYVGPPSRRYVSETSYATFKKEHAGREAVIYVGANDGMLHGFRASDGKEVLAYVPTVLLSKVKQLADKNYQHRFWVDGTPTISDVYINGKWRTVLIGGLGAGGQSVFALDVTDPSSFEESKAGDIFMWEFHDGKDIDLGYSFSRPNIVQLRDGRWYAVFGNGYNNSEKDGKASSSGQAVLYIVDIETGRLTKKLATGVGFKQAPAGVKTPNGMSFVAPVSMRSDNQVEYIYGGDLYGNIWKFDVNSTDQNDWSLDYKLFQACSTKEAAQACNSSNYQPITARPTVTLDKKTKTPIVIFGTGRNLEISDRGSRRLNAIYGIFDNGTAIPGPHYNRNLMQQIITHEVDTRFTDANGNVQTRRNRITTNNRFSSGSRRGWYMNLEVPGRGATGERVISRARIRGEQVIIPYQSFGSDPCKAGGSGGLMLLNKSTGGPLSFVAIDQNDDGKLDQKDLVTDPTTGKKVVSSNVDVGSGSTPVLTDGNLYTGGPDPDPEPEPGPPASKRRKDDPESLGRQSWRYFQ